MARIKWSERRFDFSFPVELYPELLERLRGTPARLAYRLAGVAPERLIRRPPRGWSIQEHAGHLADLERASSCHGWTSTPWVWQRCGRRT